MGLEVLHVRVGRILKVVHHSCTCVISSSGFVVPPSMIIFCMNCAGLKVANIKHGVHVVFMFRYLLPLLLLVACGWRIIVVGLLLLTCCQRVVVGHDLLQWW